VAIALLQIRTGKVKTYAGADHPWQSAIGKEPVNGPVFLTSLGLVGDTVGNPEVHGVPDQAVLAYASEHYPLWRAEGLDASPGSFGENLVVSGLTDTEACIGDVYALGEARVQISHPRQPCDTLARHFGRKDVITHVWDLRRGGWYLRVLQEGHVEAGQTWTLLDRPNPDGTVARVLGAFLNAAKDPEEALAMAHLAGLTGHWAVKLGKTKA